MVRLVHLPATMIAGTERSEVRAKKERMSRIAKRPALAGKRLTGLNRGNNVTCCVVRVQANLYDLHDEHVINLLEKIHCPLTCKL